MASMKLKLIIHSAKDLSNVKLFGTMSPYAIISMASSGRFRTSTITNGGSNPVWNESVEFIIDEDTCMQENQAIMFEIHHGGRVFDKSLGQVQVPLKRLLLKQACGEEASYPMMGGEKGTITISYTLSKVVEDSDEKESYGSIVSMKLKLIVHSGKDLNNVKLLGTMNPYAMISITSGATRLRTKTATNEGSNPVWNSSMEFSIDKDACMQENQVIIFEMYHAGTAFDRTIGQVQVPLEDLLLEHACGEEVNYLVTSGEKGTITISYTLSLVTLVSEGSKAVEESDDPVNDDDAINDDDPVNDDDPTNEAGEGVTVWSALDLTFKVVNVVTTVMEYM